MDTSFLLFKSYNHNANEDIVIKIHVGDIEKMHDAGNIMPDMSLSEVRKLLEHKSGIYMSDNMKFLNYNRQYKVCEILEEEYKVSKILDQNNCIHILEDPSMPGLFQFINNHHLFRGRYVTSDCMELKIAQQDAFKFKTNRKISQDSNIVLMENFYIPKNLFSTNNASDIFGIKKLFKKKNCEFDILEKCKIIIKPYEIEPTEKFKDAIKEALDQKTDELVFNKINQLSEKFGDFLLLETKFGIIVDSNSNTSTNSEKIRIASNNIDDHNNWGLIGYLKTVSVYELLDEFLDAELKMKCINIKLLKNTSNGIWASTRKMSKFF
ncbi:19099_t:CDS:2 [Cetraspora pellucida]|uniref:19099_t:CDS:1 n=1 Tax=Cetraspora pellucida TaxID=1433469 RepID=A0A9N8VSB2_9GLOM|nr:19099_t:CDS:2 [Cetraspora pellucida]